MPGLARSLHEMMDQHVLPHAQRDTMANLRGLMAKQRELRHVVYMYYTTTAATAGLCRVRASYKPLLLAPSPTPNPGTATGCKCSSRSTPRTTRRPRAATSLSRASLSCWRGPACTRSHRSRRRRSRSPEPETQAQTLVSTAQLNPKPKPDSESKPDPNSNPWPIPNQVALTFAMSQSEEFANVQGDVDTALDFDEFVEALLRVALSAWQDDQTVLAPWQKMRKVRHAVSGVRK